MTNFECYFIHIPKAYDMDYVSSLFKPLRLIITNLPPVDTRFHSPLIVTTPHFSDFVKTLSDNYVIFTPQKITSEKYSELFDVLKDIIK